MTYFQFFVGANMNNTYNLFISIKFIVKYFGEGGGKMRTELVI